MAPFHYGTTETSPGPSDEHAFVKIRHKLPVGSESRLITWSVTPVNAKGSAEANFAAAMTAFGQLLRGSEYMKSLSYDHVFAISNATRGTDEFGYRAEFVNLVRLAKLARAMQ